MTDFKTLGLEDNIAEAAKKLGFAKPTDIQAQAVPKILAGTNLVGQAPTGTGKTMAYLLPLVQRIDTESQAVQTVVLAPTYELAMQIADELTRLTEAGSLPVRSLALIGGANIARQIDRLKKKPQIVVGSAGRMIELMRKGKLKLARVSTLVLDEFDRLLDDQNQKSIAELVKALQQETQYLLFSATAPKKALERADFLADPEVIRVEAGEIEPSSIENFYVITPFRDKIETLRKLVHSLPVKRGLVFINRSFDAEKTLEKLQFEGIRAASLLGSNNKLARKNAVAAFRRGQVQLLVSTDLAARGLDIEGIDYVFNLDLPDTAQIYLHRAGRTGRAGAKGVAVTLADIKEAYKLEQLEKKLGRKFSALKWARKQKKGKPKKK